MTADGLAALYGAVDNHRLEIIDILLPLMTAAQTDILIKKTDFPPHVQARIQANLDASALSENNAHPATPRPSPVKPGGL